MNGSPGPDNSCRNPKDNRGGGGTMPNSSSAHAGLFGWFEGAYSRTVSTAETAYHDVAGAIDNGYHAAAKTVEAGYTVATDELRNWINSIPDHIAHATNWLELRQWAEIALGAESFELGICVGAFKNLADGIAGLLKMLRMFVLAGLYEQAHASSPISAVVSQQTYLIAKAADLVMGGAMKEADEQAKAMVKELEGLFTDPKQLFNAIGEEYEEKWDRFWALSKDTKLSSRFEAGEIVGDVLMDIIMLVQLAEGAAKLATKIPKLLAEAEKLAAEAPKLAGWARDIGTVKKFDLAEVAKKTPHTPQIIKEPPKVSESLSLTEKKEPLKRPPLKASTKKAIRDAADKTIDGKFMDANTGEIIEDDRFHYGHRYGRENRRLIREAEAKGMNQDEFNNWVNSHPEWFQIETPENNLSHMYEKPGID